jgi:hypothetical protein
MKKESFLDQIREKLDEVDDSLEILRRESSSALKAHPGEGRWSALECIEHLVRYNDFYLPEFQKCLSMAPSSRSEELKRGFLGKKFAKDMLPENGQVKSKMKTFRSKNTFASGVEPEILDTFKEQQQELRELVRKSGDKKIGSVRCKTTLPLVKFRLGYAMEFIINHQLRHTQQALKAAGAVENSTSHKAVRL